MSNKLQRNKQRANAKSLRRLGILFLLDLYMNSTYFKEFMHKTLFNQQDSFLRHMPNSQDRYAKGFMIPYPKPDMIMNPTIQPSPTFQQFVTKYIKKGDQND